ncbi:MAG: TolC family protein [Myxococcota bacterium]
MKFGQTLRLGAVAWLITAPVRAQAPAANAPAPVAKPAEAATNPAEPALPKVDDPMMVTPAPPAHMLTTWQEALQIVRQNSTTLKTARAQIELARAQARSALAPALPQLAGRAVLTDHLIRNTGPAFGATTTVELPRPPVQLSAALTLTVPLLASRAWYDYGTARDAIDSANLTAKDVERQLIALVAANIVSVVTNERLVEVSRVALASGLSNLDLTKRRAALGAASAVDVLRIEQEVSDSRAQVVAADEALRRAREALGDALGSPEPWGVTPDIRLDALANDAAASCTREAGVDLRPDVRAASAARNIAERNVKSVDYAFVPTIDAVSTLTGYSSEYMSPNWRKETWTIGAVLNWNIYDGGARYGQRAARRSDLTVAEQRLADARRRALIEVNQAVRGVQVAEARLTVSQKGRDIAAERARLTRIAYVNGTGTSFDLVDAAKVLRQAELDLAVREFQLLQAKISALLALATCKV